MLTRTAGVTERVAVPDTEAELAVIVVVPTAPLRARPLPPIVATAGVEDNHETDVVMSFVLPFVYVPVAMNCADVPAAIEAFCGETAIETNAGAVIVREAGALVMPWYAAVIFVVPGFTEVANPCVPLVLLMVATEGAEDPQFTSVVIFAVVPFE